MTVIEELEVLAEDCEECAIEAVKLRALDRSLSTGLAQLQSRFRGGNER